jgi:hypothetical protein
MSFWEIAVDFSDQPVTNWMATAVRLRMTTLRLRWLREMSEQRTKRNEDQTWRKKEGKVINNRRTAKQNKRGSTIDMPQ